jgi:hypothetical protein
MSRREVTADAVNVRVKSGTKVGTRVYLEWYCPVCKEYHWALEECLPDDFRKQLPTLQIALNCSHTLVYLPWAARWRAALSKKNVYGITREEIEKVYPL